MTDNRSPLWKLGDAWAEELERVVPKIDRQRGCERLLAGQRALVIEPRRPTLRFVVAAAMAAVVCALGSFAFLYWPVPQDFRVARVTGVEGVQIAASDQSLPIEFAQGSRIVLEQSSQARVETSTQLNVRVVLERGALHASIKRKKGSTFRVEAGPFAVVVAGTQFEVRWDPTERVFSVQVGEGSVKVSGPLIRRDQVTSVGTRCAVDLKAQSLTVGPIPQAEVSALSATATEPQAEAPTAAVDEETAEPRQSNETTHSAPSLAPNSEINEPAPKLDERQRAALPMPSELSWYELERTGKYREAVQAAERKGLSAIYEQGSASDLMQLARAARFAGRHDIGSTALLECRSRFPGSANATMAAFLLGRGASAAEAARWFATYLKEQPRGSLAREAAGRLVESYAQAGQIAHARTGAERYLAQYPDGPHADYARRLLAR